MAAPSPSAVAKLSVFPGGIHPDNEGCVDWSSNGLFAYGPLPSSSHSCTLSFPLLIFHQALCIRMMKDDGRCIFHFT